MNADDMAKALVATDSVTAVIANMTTAGGLSVAAVGVPAIILGVGAAAAIAAISYGAYLGYEAVQKKLDS
jgi:hypothetical protein